jgi:hypothetical protein
MSKGERSGSGGQGDWPVRLAGAAGGGGGVALALLLGPLVGIDGFWPGMIAVAVAGSVGCVLGRLAGGFLFPPSSGGPPEDKKGTS